MATATRLNCQQQRHKLVGMQLGLKFTFKDEGFRLCRSSAVYIRFDDKLEASATGCVGVTQSFGAKLIGTIQTTAQVAIAHCFKVLQVLYTPMAEIH